VVTFPVWDLDPGAEADGPSARPPESVAPPPPAPGDAADSTPWSALSAWASWLVPAYALGAACVLCRWLLGYVALARVLSRAEPPPAAVARLFAATPYGGRGRPRLRVCRSLRVPFSCGLLRPTVVLPTRFCAAVATPRLRWVFAHELTHLERRDAWSCLLLGLGELVYFFCPWFWWLRRQVRLCQEYVADAAVRRESRPEDYAQFLLTLTAAPAVPVNATGVAGQTSDLFRRVTMLLQDSMPVEKRCPRPWSVTAAAACLTFAALASAVGLRAADTADPLTRPEEQPKPAPAAGPTTSDPDVHRKTLEINARRKLVEAQQRLRQAQQELEDLKQLEQARQQQVQETKEAQRQFQEAERRVQEAQRFASGSAAAELDQPAQTPPLTGIDSYSPYFRGFGRFQAGRLGVLVEPPSATLADQLDLPRGEGLVIVQVQPDSVAAKAGLKPHDILLQVNGKSVPRDVGRLLQSIAEIKADTQFDVVVLRKGKNETVKGITLPEADRGQPVYRLFTGHPDFVPPKARDYTWVFPNQFFGGPGVMTTLFRTGDRFTARHQEGTLVITLTGNVADGKAKVTEITVQDGGAEHKYSEVDKVPERYRDKVKNLVEMSEKGSVKVEVQTR
jgi:hypothetical protein